MTGMSTLPVVSFDLNTRDLAAVPDAEFDALCRQIGREVLTPRWSSMLSHPARRRGLAAYADGEPVGLARVGASCVLTRAGGVQRRLPVGPRLKRPGWGHTARPWGSGRTGMRLMRSPDFVSIT